MCTQLWENVLLLRLKINGLILWISWVKWWFIMLSPSAQLRLIWDLSILKFFIGQSAPTNFLLCNMLFLFEYIAQFQITVLVRYGSGWSQFYQLSCLGVFCCVLFVRNWEFDERSPSVFIKQVLVIHDLVVSWIIIIDIVNLLVTIWK